MIGDAFNRTCLSSFDSEQLREVGIKGSNINNIQLHGGMFKGELMRIELPGLTIDYGSYNMSVIARGEFSKDFHTIGLIISCDSQPIIFKTETKPGDIYFLPAGSEFDVLSGDKPQWCALSFDKVLFEHACRRFAVEDSVLNFQDVKLIKRCNESDFLLRTIGEILFKPDLLLIGRESHAANRELVDTLLLTCFKAVFAENTHTQSRLSPRRKIVIDAENFLNATSFLDDRIKVAGLAEVLGISVRTLEYAFKDMYGITPKRYLMIRRLNYARQMILSDLSKTVTEHAIAAGYWHMSQFASDYKILFGELPSETFKNRLLA